MDGEVLRVVQNINHDDNMKRLLLLCTRLITFNSFADELSDASTSYVGGDYTKKRVEVNDHKKTVLTIRFNECLCFGRFRILY